jgi:hypothetical protein
VRPKADVLCDGERYRTKLSPDPFNAVVASRPTGWISRRALDEQVLQRLFERTPIVGFSAEGWKGAASFVTENGEVVADLATHDLRQPMNEASAPFSRGDNEFARAGLTMADSAWSLRRGWPRAWRHWMDSGRGSDDRRVVLWR